MLIIKHLRTLFFLALPFVISLFIVGFLKPGSVSATVEPGCYLPHAELPYALSTTVALCSPDKCYRFTENNYNSAKVEFDCTKMNQCIYETVNAVIISNISCKEFVLNFTYDAESSEAIRNILATECAADSFTGSADSIEEQVTECKENYFDTAKDMYNTCHSNNDSEDETLACIEEAYGKPISSAPDNAGNADDAELEAKSDSFREPDASRYGGIYNLIIIILRVLGALAGIAIVGSLVMAGVQYATAGDNSGAISKAKTRIAYTLIALVVYAMMYYIATWLIPS